MKKLILVLVMTIPCLSFATTPENNCEVYELNILKKDIALCDIQIGDVKIFISKNCNTKKCLAYDAYFKAKNVVIDPTPEDVPEEVDSIFICEKLKGEIVFATSKEPDYMSRLFCSFPDNSYIIHYALETEISH